MASPASFTALSAEPVTPRDDRTATTRRALILRDSITFLVLLSITVTLSLVTWLLFRSFTAHRADLARRWSERGRDALTQGRPQDAIVALRTALSFAPDDRSDELSLAEALGAAGHTEEATAYFLGLHDATPGDGYLNLQLARLARKANRPQEAIDDYHAAIFGNWGEMGVERRREVRLELADYFTLLHRPEEARDELLIAGRNNPNDPAFAAALGLALERANALDRKAEPNGISVQQQDAPVPH